MQNSPIDSMLAMLTADLAVETVCKAACFHLKLAVDDKANMVKMLEPLEKALPAIKGAPETLEAERHRKNRNLVQHQGQVPDAQMVALSVADAERFCALIVREAFQRDLSSISVVELVRHHQLRGLLDHALQLLRSRNHEGALICALAAFDFLHFTWARAIRLADGYDESHDRFRAATCSRFLATVGINLTMPHPDDENPYPLFARMTLGMPVDELLRIRTLQEDVETKHRAGGKPRYRARDIEFVVEAVARAAWRLETAHPTVVELMADLYKQAAPAATSEPESADETKPEANE